MKNFPFRIEYQKAFEILIKRRGKRNLEIEKKNSRITKISGIFYFTKKKNRRKILKIKNSKILKKTVYFFSNKSSKPSFDSQKYSFEVKKKKKKEKMK